jgi:hypothetical protein
MSANLVVDLTLSDSDNEVERPASAEPLQQREQRQQGQQQAAAEEAAAPDRAADPAPGRGGGEAGRGGPEAGRAAGQGAGQPGAAGAERAGSAGHGPGDGQGAGQGAGPAGAVPEANCDQEEANALLRASEFECGICMDLLHDPVVASCGHDFCQTCLDGWALRQSWRVKCPVCRADILQGPDQQLGAPP